MKIIVFVRNAASPRMYNQAFALRQSNKYKLILVCKTFDQYTLGKFNKVFDEIICYQPLDLQKHWLRQDVRSSFPIHFMKYVINHYIEPRIGRMSSQIRLPRILKQLKADVCVCQSTEQEIIMQVMKNTKSPVILDVHNGSPVKGIENLSKAVHEKEKYFFEHASGIIHRGTPEIELNYYKERGYKITCPTLQFLDCCNKDFFVNKNVKLSSEDGEYHLVSMGGGHSSVYLVSLVKKLAKQKMHYHVYLVPYSIISPIVFKKLKGLDKTEKYFHLETAVPFDKVPQEIAKYDFGLHLYTSAFLNQSREEYLKIATSNRIFTYFEAGLPIILSNRLEYMKKITEENKAGFSVKDEELDNLHSMIKKYNYNELRENVLKAREKFLIYNYAKRLVKFYDTVIQTI